MGRPGPAQVGGSLGTRVSGRPPSEQWAVELSRVLDCLALKPLPLPQFPALAEGKALDFIASPAHQLSQQ